MKHSILCVDDEVDNVDALERLFRRKFTVHRATSAREALGILAQNPVTVIISDQRMPQMTGVEFLAESIKTHPHAIRILLTGYTDVESVVAAINAGQIYRYVTKPWDPVDLSNAVDKAVERFEIGVELYEKNRALETALEELQTLDAAKNQFMVLVNHELKTPLTSMLSFADLLNETSLDSDQSRMLSRIRSAALRLQEMINDALELIAAETNQLRPEMQAIEAESVFSPSVLPEVIRDLAVQRKVKFSFSIEAKVLLCDEKIMRGVFRRLAHNAAKFADSGSTIFVTGKAQEPGQYTFEIRNAGRPIDERRLAQLTKPFTLNEDVMNHSVGTGMGLAICQAMLKLHSTTIKLMSREQTISASFVLPLKGR